MDQIKVNRKLPLKISMEFYYPETDTFYGLHTEEFPFTLYKLHRHPDDSPFIGFQCSGDTHEHGDIVPEVQNREDLWSNVVIGGKSLEYVLNHSYIIKLD